MLVAVLNIPVPIGPRSLNGQPNDLGEATPRAEAPYSHDQTDQVEAASQCGEVWEGENHEH